MLLLLLLLLLLAPARDGTMLWPARSSMGSTSGLMGRLQLAPVPAVGQHLGEAWREDRRSDSRD